MKQDDPTRQGHFESWSGRHRKARFTATYTQLGSLAVVLIRGWSNERGVFSRIYDVGVHTLREAGMSDRWAASFHKDWTGRWLEARLDELLAEPPQA